ncbi:MAG: DNA gyrase subunit A, partial [bacterium]
MAAPKRIPPPPRDPDAQPEVKDVDLSHQMRENYITYALSVIKARALPDVRDGLKPVHRRILYVMHEAGYRADKPHVKSASVVGDALKMYHPHGDTAVYDAMVRLAQDFSVRYLLVDGQGNFGSVDGDPPAAYRYTETRMHRLAEELLIDVDKSTVDYQPNFDDSRQEPSVLPSRIPHLLMNGSDGIAVGMATSIPPHHLGEIVEGTLAYLKNPDITNEELLKFIKGPDFPTGGIIRGIEGIKSAYTTGKGYVDLYAVADIEPLKDRSQIVVTEIPFQVNKSSLLEQIRAGVETGKLLGISDLRDESDRNGMRIVIECKRDAIPRDVLKRLYKFTALYKRWHIHLLALGTAYPPRDPRKKGLAKLPIRPYNQPITFTLKGMISAYCEHRFEVIVRRTMHDLAEAEARAHILEGLLKALDHIDRIITLIRGSVDAATARKALMEEFAFSEIQANAILDMQLRRLVGLERDKLQAEYDQLMATIADYKDILANDP